MKGVVFNILEDMVLEQGGITLWRELLSKAGVTGAYTSVETYADAELFALVNEVSKALNKPVEEVVRAFGEFMFSQLAKRYPVFVDSCDDLFSFLDSIDSVIHLEVKKLYAEANLPNIHCEQSADHHMVMDYRSPRKLCILSEGLIHGAAIHYNTSVKLKHDVCMHRGSDHCEIEIEIVA